MQAVKHIVRTVTLQAPSPGFLGEGHTAIEVLDPKDTVGNDPFVLLMDDHLNVGPQVRKLGGAHPHAGLETVTLFLEGTLIDPDEGDTAEGDVQWMTAGRGIIHGENVRSSGQSRILQLWIRLPASHRSVEPRVQLIRKKDVPTRREAGVEARIYSGTSGGLRSPTKNYAPIIMVDFHLNAGAEVSQELPAGYRGFLYAVSGSVTVHGQQLSIGQVGFFEEAPGAQSEPTELRFVGGPRGARFVLYAGQPQREPCIQYGPFVAQDMDAIQRLNEEFRKGGFVRLSQLGGVA